MNPVLNSIQETISQKNREMANKEFGSLVLFGALLLVLGPVAIWGVFIDEHRFHFGRFLVFFPLVLYVGFTCYLATKSYIEHLKLARHPENDYAFTKYGSADALVKIVTELNTASLYEDKHMVLSKNYIWDKTDYSSIQTLRKR